MPRHFQLPLTSTRSFNLDVRGDDALFRRDEAESLTVRRLEIPDHEVRLGKEDGKRRIRPLVAQV